VTGGRPVLDVKIALDGNRAAAAQIGMATEIARAMSLILVIDRDVEFRWRHHVVLAFDSSL
jgi:hypothetical protein